MLYERWWRSQFDQIAKWRGNIVMDIASYGGALNLSYDHGCEREDDEQKEEKRTAGRRPL